MPQAKSGSIPACNTSRLAPLRERRKLSSRCFSCAANFKTCRFGVGPETVVVIVGDGAEWIRNRASMFVRRCEILDFWHALEYAWEFARIRYGAGSAQADRWVHDFAEKLRAGKVDEVIEGLKRLRPKTPESRESLQALIRYYRENATGTWHWQRRCRKRA
jgi:hypothetical protein